MECEDSPHLWCMCCIMNSGRTSSRTVYWKTLLATTASIISLHCHFFWNFITGGHYAVGIFFVLSGYVLSAKPLMHIHAGDFVLLGDNLGSAVFRRWFRLYLPIIVTTLGIVILWHVFGISANLHPQRTLGAELWVWYNEFKSFTWILNSSPPVWFTYNPHTWTIPLEFKGSLVVYVTLTALSRCTRTARLCCEIALIFYFIWIVDGLYFALFAGGLLLCDLDLLAAKDELPIWMTRHLKPSLLDNLLFLVHHQPLSRRRSFLL